MSQAAPKPFTPAQERFGSVVIKLMSALNVLAYRWTGGWLGGRFFGGAPVLLMTVKGRRTGTPYVIPLLYLQQGRDYVIVASKGGMSHHPLWFKNLEANPRVEVEIGRTRQAMRARCASADEKAALWPKLVAMYKDYAVYQARTTRDIPVLILSPD
jgi:deazaflavin-dependent oxidoreductase (nitroreductase family)